MDNKKKPSVEDLISSLGREIADIGTKMHATLAGLADQVTVANRVRDGRMDFTYRDRRFSLMLPEASSDLHQLEIARAGTFADIGILERAEKHMKHGAVIIDAGACIGNHTIWFASQVQGSMVHAFEPMRTTFSLLESNVRMNGLDNVQLHNTALGDTEGNVKLQGFEIDKKNIGGTRFAQCREDTPYRMETIDGMELEKLDFIKIDVEGMQLQVLKGAEKTIDRLHPAILVELFPGKQQHTKDTWDEDAELNLPKQFLWEHGYELHRVSAIDWLCSPR